MFAKISGNTVLEWPIPSINARFPNISFSTKGYDNLPDGYVFVGVIPQPDPQPGKKIVPGMPVKQGEVWVQSWDLVDLTDAELKDISDNQAFNIRRERDALLQESDLSILKAYEQGIPAPAVLVEYRQKLRDITLQPGFPQQVEWPIKP
jgi:hypothetical protein